MPRKTKVRQHAEVLRVHCRETHSFRCLVSLETAVLSFILPVMTFYLYVLYFPSFLAQEVDEVYLRLKFAIEQWWEKNGHTIDATSSRFKPK